MGSRIMGITMVMASKCDERCMYVYMIGSNLEVRVFVNFQHIVGEGSLEFCLIRGAEHLRICKNVLGDMDS
jgi:hypothetical protein